ncbi:MAG: flagellar hook basal-body protein [Deltaproteobacteria bacterium]|nr:flagellar hook basal-body protein [Deltaproteobacteria bacterium]
MADGMYVSMAGAVARERQLDSIADNLANATTPGYKASRPVFDTILAEEGSIRAYPRAMGTGTDLKPGPTQVTGNPLDVLPEDGNFLAVRKDDGSTAYTRDGRLQVDANGTVRAAGLPVLSRDGGTFSIAPQTSLSITAEGMMMSDGQEIGRLGTFKLTGQTTRLGSSLISANPDQVAQTDSRVVTGAVEQSNHSALESMVEMVSAQRNFEASMQAIDAYKKIGDRSNELGRVR